MADKHIIAGAVGEVVIIDGDCHKLTGFTKKPPDSVSEKNFRTCRDCNECKDYPECPEDVHWATAFVPECDLDLAALLEDELIFWASYRKEDHLFPGKEYDGETCPEGQVAIICGVRDDYGYPTPPEFISNDEREENGEDVPSKPVECPDTLVVTFPSPCEDCYEVIGAAVSVPPVNGNYESKQAFPGGCIWGDSTDTYELVFSGGTWIIREVIDPNIPTYVELYSSPDNTK
jgi:hypothetical protein